MRNPVLNSPAFRRFKFFEDDIKIVPLLFDADLAQGHSLFFPDDTELEDSTITGISVDFNGGVNNFSLAHYVYNQIVYTVLTPAAMANFALNLNNINEGENEKTILENFPISTLLGGGNTIPTVPIPFPMKSSGFNNGFWAAKFRFTTAESFVTKWGAAVLTPPYCIPLLFSYKLKK